MLRFDDDIALLANTKRELEETLNVTETVFNNYNMKINIGKTKVIACRTKSGKKRSNIQIGNEKLGEISEFCYLGNTITRDGHCNTDIRSQKGQAKIAFAEIPQLLISNIDLEIRKKLFITYVWSVALYHCEAETIGNKENFMYFSHKHVLGWQQGHFAFFC